MKNIQTIRFRANRIVILADAEPCFVVETPHILEKGITIKMAID